MAYNTVTEQLRNAIKASCQSLRQIAKGADVDVTSISRFLNKERDITGDTLDKLCKYFKLELVPRKKKH